MEMKAWGVQTKYAVHYGQGIEGKGSKAKKIKLKGQVEAKQLQQTLAGNKIPKHNRVYSKKVQRGEKKML